MPDLLKPLPLRLGLVLLIWLGYGFSFLAIYEQIGPQALGLVLLPTLVSAYFVSWLRGLAAAGVAIAVNFVLFTRLQEQVSAQLYIETQGIFDLISLVLLAICVAYISQSRNFFRAGEVNLQDQTDSLTGLLTLASFESKLTQALQIAGAMDLQLAVLIIDLNRFKVINDSYGRDAGDALLKQLSKDLASSLRQGDIIGRLGSDEFIIALQGLSSSKDAAKVAEQLIQLVNSPVIFEQVTLQVTGSVGISLYPEDAKTVAELVKHAEGAMYEVKNQSKRSIVFSTQALQSRRSRLLRMERALAQAVAKQELELRYQPQVDLATGRTLGFEALVRWNSPDFGLVSPAEFIPLAEQTKDIIPIGQWVIREACLQQRRWHQAGFPDLKVAVNVSVVEFAEGDLSKTIHHTLEETEVAPQQLEIEITESLMVENMEHTTETLRVLTQLGVHTALDDFGTGHSSLAYLQRLPIQTIKIDRVFIMHLEDLEHSKSTDATVIVEAILAMAHKMHKTVVAEGIETASQSAFLASLKCPVGQGYYYGKPLSVSEVERYLENEFATKETLKTLVDVVDDRFDSMMLRDTKE